MKKLLFLLPLAFCILPFASAQTIYVDVTNSTGIEDGTEQHPFNTIKEGINASSAGYTVMIKKGTYVPDDSWSGNPHTLLLKAGVSLVGESRGNTLIDGIVVDRETSNLSIRLEKLSFDEFHFCRGTSAGPFTDRNVIRNCATSLISLPFGPGIPVNDSTPGPNYGFLIEHDSLGADGNIEFKQGDGVSDLSVLSCSCASIMLSSGGGYTYLIDSNDVQYGIYDASAANITTISRNRILNGFISDKSGGNQYGVEDEIIEDNVITADENSPAFVSEDYKAGILAKSRSVTIRNNIITCTGNVSGIRSSAGAPMNITDNTITLDEVQQYDPDPYTGTLGIFNYAGAGVVTGNNIHGGDQGYYSKAGTYDFAYNIIEKAYTGFYSKGAEEVHHNTVKECKGDGLILDGLKGPLHHNTVINNTGSGILLLRVPIDLGGGADGSPGLNTLKGNGNFDLYVLSTSTQNPTVYARYNFWDHADPDSISQFDIRDGNDSTGLVRVDFTPAGAINDRDPVSALNAFPDPFSNTTVIRWEISTGSHVIMEVYDMMGREICTLMNEDLKPGSHRVIFDGTGLPAGAYIIKVNTCKTRHSKNLVIIKK